MNLMSSFSVYQDLVLWEPARDMNLMTRPSSPAPSPGRPRSLTSSSSIPPPSTDMEDSRPMPRRTSSWASSPPRSRSPPMPPRTPQKPRETEHPSESTEPMNNNTSSAPPCE